MRRLWLLLVTSGVFVVYYWFAVGFGDCGLCWLGVIVWFDFDEV